MDKYNRDLSILRCLRKKMYNAYPCYKKTILIFKTKLTIIIGDVNNPQAKNSRNIIIRAWYTLGDPNPEL